MAELVDLDSGRLALAGRLTSDSVVELESQGRALLTTAGARYEIDLAEVTSSSSAGVALMLAWLRAARAADAEVTFKNLPSSLLGLLRVAELSDKLPIADQADAAASA